MIDFIAAYYLFLDKLKDLFMDQDIVALMEEMIYLNETEGEIPEDHWEQLNFMLWVRFTEFGSH